MKMNRRSFTQLLAVLGLGSTVSVTTGCPAWLTSIYNDIKEYAPAILGAIAAVLSILTGSGVLSLPLGAIISSILNLISKSVGDLQLAVNTYQQAAAAQKPGLLGAITAALSDAEANIQQFWNDLTIPDPALATTIENLLGVVVSTLQGYINSLPPTTPTPAMVRRSALARTIQVPAKRRSVTEFKRDFNAVLKPTAYGKHAL